MSPPEPRLQPPYLFAFLRAVNLGKHNKVPMKRLMELLADEGFPPAEFLLASGNLVFGSTKRATKALRTDLERLVEREFGVKTSPVLRTSAALADVVGADPFDHPAGGRVHVALWNRDEKVASEALRELAGTDFSPDEIALIENGAYLRFASTSHDSRLSNAVIERKLGVRSTVRNVNTFKRLLERWPAGN